MRVHLLAPPNGQTTAVYPLDGFLQMTIRFATLLKRLGHTVILYASEENDAPCDELVTCITKAEQIEKLTSVPYQSADYNFNHPLFVTFNARAAVDIGKRKQHGDVIATICGTGQYQVAQPHPELRLLEYSIGYKGVVAPFRIYQSHAWRHTVHGFTGCEHGRDFDDVIPPFFEAREFPKLERPDDYVLYVGRLCAVKGVETACRAAAHAGARLLVIGHGDPSLVTYGEYLGAVTTPERNRLLGHARAVLMPTKYLEPFGNVSAEAQLCGTPVISTDYGAFVESVEQGKTGYRCRYLGEFAEAIERSRRLDRRYIRERAFRLYSMEAAEVAYRAYFERFQYLTGDGWHTVLAHQRHEPEVECVA